MLVYGYNGDIVCDHASSTSGQLNRAGETMRRTTNASSDIYKNNGHVIPKSTTVVYLICYKHVEMGGSSSTYSGIPLLSFMYLDHEITDVSWKKAGSIIDLTEYRKLYNYIVENKTKMRWQKSSNENDTWFY